MIDNEELHTMKPYLVCFDTETTGLDVQRDWVIQLSLVKVDAQTFEEVDTRDWYIRPSGAYTIAPEAQAVHHITREKLETAGVLLRDVYADFVAFVSGCDMLSYNGNAFDVRILYYNFMREGLSFDFEALRFYDAYLIEATRTSRRLGDVYRRYYGKDFEDAHNALADVRATIAVFRAQQQTAQSAEEFARPEFDFVSLDGFLCPVQRPSGAVELVFAQGKHKGKTLSQVQSSEPSYLDWVSKNCAAPTRTLIEQTRTAQVHIEPCNPPQSIERTHNDPSTPPAPTSAEPISQASSVPTPPSKPSKKRKKPLADNPLQTSLF